MNKSENRKPIYSIQYKTKIINVGFLIFLLFLFILIPTGIYALLIKNDFLMAFETFGGSAFLIIFIIVFNSRKIITIEIFQDNLQFSNWFNNLITHYPQKIIRYSHIKYILRDRYYIWICLKNKGLKYYNKFQISSLSKKQLDDLISAFKNVGLEIKHEK